MIYDPALPPPTPSSETDQVCPVCGAEVDHERCKVVCRSDTCVYRVIQNCSEF
jgi:hypothetical protein